MKKQYSAIIVGCGGITAAWLDAIKAINQPKKRVEIVGLVDLNIKHAEEKKKKFSLPAARTGTDLNKMLQETGADIVSLRHPESVKRVKDAIEELIAVPAIA